MMNWRGNEVGVIQANGVVEKQVPPPEAPDPKRRFDRSDQVDRGRHTPREEERLGAPRSASATPARHWKEKTSSARRSAPWQGR
jgi:hypothetical protein